MVITHKLYKRDRAFNISIINIAITLLVMLAGFAFFERQKENARIRNRLTRCKSNLKNLSTAMEMYNSDHQHYPETLSPLTPNYLKTIPKSPGGDQATYDLSFKSSDRRKEVYLLTCTDPLHQEFTGRSNYWSLDGELGLLDRYEQSNPTGNE